MSLKDIDNIENEIRELIATVLEVEADAVLLDAHLVEDLGADSMMGLEIVAHLETKYKIEIPEERLPKLATLRNIIELVKGLL